MAKKKFVYGNYYKVGQQVKVGLKLTNTVVRESNGEVTFLEDNLIRVEILGGAIPQIFSVKKGGPNFSVSGWSGWGFYCCDAILENILDSKELVLKLAGEVDEKQRREYFRLDVDMPLILEIPTSQSPSSIQEQCNSLRAKYLGSKPPEMIPSGKGYRAVLLGGRDVLSQTVNLSGGGVRVRATSAIPTGNALLVHILLPIAPARVIVASAEVLRCSEVKLRIEKDPLFIIAMKFVEIDENDREALISYIFAEQRKQLKAEADIDDRN